MQKQVLLFPQYVILHLKQVPVLIDPPLWVIDYGQELMSRAEFLFHPHKLIVTAIDQHHTGRWLRLQHRR